MPCVRKCEGTCSLHPHNATVNVAKVHPPPSNVGAFEDKVLEEMKEIMFLVYLKDLVEEYRPMRLSNRHIYLLLEKVHTLSNLPTGGFVALRILVCLTAWPTPPPGHIVSSCGFTTVR